MLDDQEREPRMPGAKTVLLTHEDGIEGLFDSITREILVEAIEDGFKVLDEIEDMRGSWLSWAPLSRRQQADDWETRYLARWGLWNCLRGIPTRRKRYGPSVTRGMPSPTPPAAP
ncbi:hypothetical protein [Pseudarthrobacter quantipunctorum]|uniref:Uncharacterized protein n=1 Tax=Pseudarthrobacter quantipunctorum TaxID=3128980 RepID=A0ABZ2R1V0_9MICC